MTEPAVPPAGIVATDVIRVSVTPDDVGHHARMLDLLQRLHESNGLNAREEVLPVIYLLARAFPRSGSSVAYDVIEAVAPGAIPPRAGYLTLRSTMPTQASAHWKSSSCGRLAHRHRHLPLHRYRRLHAPRTAAGRALWESAERVSLPHAQRLRRTQCTNGRPPCRLGAWREGRARE